MGHRPCRGAFSDSMGPLKLEFRLTCALRFVTCSICPVSELRLRISDLPLLPALEIVSLSVGLLPCDRVSILSLDSHSSSVPERGISLRLPQFKVF